MASRPSPPRNRSLVFFSCVLLIRLINSWTLATFFQPDEYFQALEPAWHTAFGARSGAWLTWEWQYQLRSSLHPLLFSGAYLCAERLSTIIPAGNALRSAIIMASPRVVQAVLATLGDWYTWRLASTIYTDNVESSFALLLQVFSPWQWYVSTRTFSNSLETTLTIMALHYWPWDLLGGNSAQPPIKENAKMNIHHHNHPLRSLLHLRLSLCLAALAVVLRPTNILIWGTVAAMTLMRVTLTGPSPLTQTTVLVLLREAVLCGGLVVAVSLAADRAYFGFWTFPPYNWLYFNISKSLAVFYGRNPWHYYLVQGIPLLSTTSLPFVVRALYKPVATSVHMANILKTLTYTVYATIGALSLISHKEARFIYPLLPILNVLAAPLAASFFTTPSPRKLSPGTKTAPRRWSKPRIFTAVGINIILAGFLSYLHQPAPLTVLDFLRHEYERINPAAVQLAHVSHFRDPTLGLEATKHSPDELFALFLMPCHTTPWRSHLVYPGLSAYALTCEPPLHTQPNSPERENYRDEADRFYDSPSTFLGRELFAASSPHAKTLPRYIVGFDGIEPWLYDFLKTPEGKALKMNLRRVWAGFNGFFNEDWRREGQMIVWDTGVYENGLPASKI